MLTHINSQSRSFFLKVELLLLFYVYARDRHLIRLMFGSVYFEIPVLICHLFLFFSKHMTDSTWFGESSNIISRIYSCSENISNGSYEKPYILNFSQVLLIFFLNACPYLTHYDGICYFKDEVLSCLGWAPRVSWGGFTHITYISSNNLDISYWQSSFWSASDISVTHSQKCTPVKWKSRKKVDHSFLNRKLHEYQKNVFRTEICYLGEAGEPDILDQPYLLIQLLNRHKHVLLGKVGNLYFHLTASEKVKYLSHFRAI